MFISFNSGPPPGNPFTRLLTAIFGLLMLGVALFFAFWLFVVLAVAGVLVWAYFWWKTRALRRSIEEQLRAQGHASPRPEWPAGSREPQEPTGDVIDGESVRLDEGRGPQ